eukprot:SAG22_NODE_17677_length_300_cov_1.268657_1_plen_61_part_01
MLATMQTCMRAAAVCLDLASLLASVAVEAALPRERLLALPAGEALDALVEVADMSVEGALL